MRMDKLKSRLRKICQSKALGKENCGEPLQMGNTAKEAKSADGCQKGEQMSRRKGNARETENALKFARIIRVRERGLYGKFTGE